MDCSWDSLPGTARPGFETVSRGRLVVPLEVSGSLVAWPSSFASGPGSNICLDGPSPLRHYSSLSLFGADDPAQTFGVDVESSSCQTVPASGPDDNALNPGAPKAS